MKAFSSPILLLIFSGCVCCHGNGVCSLMRTVLGLILPLLTRPALLLFLSVALDWVLLDLWMPRYHNCANCDCFVHCLYVEVHINIAFPRSVAVWAVSLFMALFSTARDDVRLVRHLNHTKLRAQFYAHLMLHVTTVQKWLPLYQAREAAEGLLRVREHWFSYLIKRFSAQLEHWRVEQQRLAHKEA